MQLNFISGRPAKFFPQIADVRFQSKACVVQVLFVPKIFVNFFSGQNRVQMRGKNEQ